MRKKRDGSGPRRLGPRELEGAQLRETKFFGTPAFRRLWISQVFSSLGDWIGIVATSAIAYRIAGEGGLSLVLAVRLGLAFVFASFAGVLIDRHDRKQIMVLTYVGRALVFCFVPFIEQLWALLFASVLLELMTLLYSPAKEASVPNLVPKKFLPTANSLGLVAAYGTFPFAAGVFSALTGLATWLVPDARIGSLQLTDEFMALYFNAAMYIVSALFIATLALPSNKRTERANTDDSRARASLKEAAEGFSFVKQNRKVRAVVFGLAAGLIGGGSVVPLGAPFATQVLGAGSSGFGLLLTAMGTGMAIGVVTLTVLFKKVQIERVFVAAIFGAGISLAVAASMHGLGAAAMCVGLLGLSAGAVYVIGFTSLQMNVDDELRGRVFATFYTLTRVCILLAITAAPFVARGIDKLSQRWLDGQVSIGSSVVLLPGVRITLWLAALIIITAGVFVFVTFRRNRAVAGGVNA